MDYTNKLLTEYDEIYESDDLEKIRKTSAEIKYGITTHLNYEFFWESLAPIKERGGKIPDPKSDLGMAINKTFGSFDKLIFNL